MPQISTSSRTVWITGASSGIGWALAERFAMGGDAVIASARSVDKLTALQSSIRSKKGNCEVISCNVQFEDNVQEAANRILRKYESVDLLINNAGVTYFKNFLSTSIQEYDHILNTNLRGLFLTTKAVLPGMIQRHTGAIFNILSVAAKITYTSSSVYSASKAGAEALMNGLRAEVRKDGIQIVNIYPGATSTPIWPEKQQEKYHDQMLRPSDIAELLYQLSLQPPSLMVEELVLRPQIGDLVI